MKLSLCAERHTQSFKDEVPDLMSHMKGVPSNRQAFVQTIVLSLPHLVLLAAPAEHSAEALESTLLLLILPCTQSTRTQRTTPCQLVKLACMKESISRPMS